MRIAAMSDLHGSLPELPPNLEADLLILAGDLCPDRLKSLTWARYDPTCQAHWLTMSLQPWLLEAQRQGRFKACLMTWGNHDYIGLYPDLVPDWARPFVLVDEPFSVGPIKFWFSPWSPRFMNWAFMKGEAELADLYRAIPDGVDVLVSHTPPFGAVDTPMPGGPSVGSLALRDAITRIKPEVVICGHIHGGHGQYTRLWAEGACVCGEDSHMGILRGCPQHQPYTTRIYNVSIVDEAYRVVHPVTVIDLEDR